MASNRILVGTSSFTKRITANAFFVDKTEFIREFIDGPEVSVILRPRRFGKSTNLSLLASFLSIYSELDSFDDFKIGKDFEFCRLHFKKYPVVCVSFKDCEGETWDQMRKKVWNVLRKSVTDHFKHGELKLNVGKEVDFKDDNPPQDFEDILLELTKALFEKHKQRSVILIDEYDAPLNAAFRRGYYDKAALFFRNLYSSAFKDNESLEKACLMGIMEVRGESVFSGLNNFHIFSVADKIYSSHFGFTIDEISPYCDGNQLDSVKFWYNGYQIGDNKLINPWSFSSWLYQGRQLKSYWVGTSSIESLGNEVSPHLRDILQEVLELSFNEGYGKFISGFSSQIRYDNQLLPYSAIWNLLIHTGYLSYQPDKISSNKGFAYIPNYELLLHWQNVMPLLLAQQAASKEISNAFVEALSAFDIKKLPDLLRQLVHSVSHFNLRHEVSYHMLCHGLLFGICLQIPNCSVSSDREAGHGRYDLVLEFRETKKAIVIEFKKSSSEERLDQDAQNGLDQIIKKNYMAEFPGFTLLLIGVSFYGKHVSLLKTKIYPELL